MIPVNALPFKAGKAPVSTVALIVPATPSTSRVESSANIEPFKSSVPLAVSEPVMLILPVPTISLLFKSKFPAS